MFTPDASIHHHSLRSKRSRQAAGNDESVKLPLTKKRRSALRRDTFEPLTEASLNQIAGREATETTNGHAIEPKKITLQTTELTLRGARKGEKRNDRGGGLLTLSSNEFYTVAQLPSLPEEIRSRPNVQYSCVISPEYDYVLALTHTEALIWSYNTSSSVPSARDLISFPLSFPPASVDDPLPLAALTAKSANGEPGIVVVSPKWGKIVYWDKISTASSFVPGQTMTGVQGSVPSIGNGEIIKELVNAEPAGFIITTSYGRVAHVTVRDQMGRPGIGVQYMRKSQAGVARGGILGSIRNVFGNDRRKSTPIVHPGNSTKAQRDVLVATEDGELEIWSTNLGVGNMLVRSIDLKEQLASYIEGEIKILDLALVPTLSTSSTIVRRGDVESLQLVVLVGTDEKYNIVEMNVSGEDAHVRVIHAIKCYESVQSSIRPRLCLGKSQPIAFVLFETAVVLMSLAKIKESPSSQLLKEKSALPDQFQDCIKFQEDTIYRVLGYAAESIDGKAACVFAVQGFGIVRISSKLRNGLEIDVDDIESRLGPKSRIEQAVFFGTNRQNPLNLNTINEEGFTSEEVACAVLEISNEILSSESKYLSKSTSSIETQMKIRAKAMEDLISHVLKYYPSAASRSVKFQLLHNAEKLASAQAIWKVQESIQRTYPHNDGREMTYLNFTLRALHETRQKYPDQEKGETDHVRHWLVNSVPRIDHLISELVSSLRELEDMDVRDPKTICDYLGEAVDLWTATYRTAFKFREDNAPLYGLGDEVFDEGVLQTGYPENLTHPWTSEKEPFRFGQRLIYNVCQFLDLWGDFNQPTIGKNKKTQKISTNLEGKPYEAPSNEAMHSLAARLPYEVELFSKIAKEENIQTIANIKLATSDLKEQQKQINEVKRELRPRTIRAVETITKYNMQGAIELAEKFKDPGLLVVLNEQYIMDLGMQLIASHDQMEKQQLERKKRKIQQHVETYFEKFGNGWAYAHFSHLINIGSAGSVLAEAQAHRGQKQNYLTWFLDYSANRGQNIGKISWINDVVGEQRYGQAQKTLEAVAVHEESDIWAKKTEFCLAKLTGFAAAEKMQSKSKMKAARESSAKYDDALALLDIQECVAQHVKPSISDAIDAKAARDLSLDVFGRLIVDKHPAFKKLLSAALSTTIANKALTLVSMIDILTLADPVEFVGMPDEDPDIVGHEFALALQSIDLVGLLPTADLDALRTIVWRRAMIRDDWSLLNNTSGKSDREVIESMQLSSLFRTLLEICQRQETERISGSGHNIKLFSPEDILASQSVLSEPLKTKYIDCVGLDVNSTEASKFVAQLEKDFTSEQDRLRRFVEKARLGEHFGSLVKEAEKYVAEFTQAQVNGNALA